MLLKNLEKTIDRFSFIYISIFVLLAILIPWVNSFPVFLISPEFDNYFISAQNLKNGLGYKDIYHPPVYIFLTALFSKLLDIEALNAGRFISALAAGGILVLTFRISKNILNTSLSFLTILLLSLHPEFILHSMYASTDMLFSFEFLTIIFICLKYSNRFDNKNIFLLGLLFGIGYLTRYNMIFIFPIIIMVLFLQKKIKIIENIILFVLGLSLIYVPIYLLNLIFHGNILINENWRNFAFSLYGNEDFRNLLKFEYSSFINTVIHNPLDIVRFIGRNFSEYIDSIPDLHIIPLFYVFFILGGIYLYINLKFYFKIITVLIISYLFFLIISFNFLSRLLIPIMPFFIIISFAGIIQLKEFLKNKIFIYYIIVLFIVIISLLNIYSNIIYLKKDVIYSLPIEEVHLINEIINTSSKFSLIGIVSSYSYMKEMVDVPSRIKHFYIDFKDENTINTINLLSEENVEYLLISDRTAFDFIKKGLIDKISSDWHLLKELSFNWGKIRLYKNIRLEEKLNNNN